MMKEWATVVAWENGVVTLKCESRSGCGTCSARAGCGTRILNKLGPESEHKLQVKYDTALVSGQKVEIGIAENHLLGSAFLVYMFPLFGLFIFGGLLQWLTGSDLNAALGAVTGGLLGFWLARRIAINIERKTAFQPVILQVGLPPSLLHVQEDSE